MMSSSTSSRQQQQHDRPPVPPPVPPKLVFDDGSRVMAEQPSSSSSSSPSSTGWSGGTAPPPVRSIGSNDNNIRPPSCCPIEEYYEFDRLCDEIVQLFDNNGGNDGGNDDGDGDDDNHTAATTTAAAVTTTTVTIKIALQFPDDLIEDSPGVCRLFEERLADKQQRQRQQRRRQSRSPPVFSFFVFVLGDSTTSDSYCCPDVAAAQHLKADILVHYGHACLSSNLFTASNTNTNTTATTTARADFCCRNAGNNNNNNKKKNGKAYTKEATTKVPIILYGFGKSPLDIEPCVRAVIEAAEQRNVKRLLLLYELQYHHAIEELQTGLSERGDILVVCGDVPATPATTEAGLSMIVDHRSGSSNHEQRRQDHSSSSCCCNSANNNNDKDSDNTNDPFCSSSHMGGGGFGEDDDDTGVGRIRQQQQQQQGQQEQEQQNSNNHGDGDAVRGADPYNTNVGGLTLPTTVLDCLSSYTLLYVGDDQCRQYLNIMIRFLSLPSEKQPAHYWTYHREQQGDDNDDNKSSSHEKDDEDQRQQPQQSQQQRQQRQHGGGVLTTQLSPRFRRILNRRFYLIQKAKQVDAFGILIANTLSSYSGDDNNNNNNNSTTIRSVVASIRTIIRRASKSSYTVHVGKINAAKLSNFAEIGCWVMVSCPEHALLENERDDFAVPVITPLELAVAFDRTDWETGVSRRRTSCANDGSNSSNAPPPYSLNVQDYLSLFQNSSNNGDNDDDDDDDGGGGGSDDSDGDDDAPYYSLVMGQYVQKSSTTKSGSNDEDVDLKALPGKGQLTTYGPSAAGEFLKRREYRGLVRVNEEDNNEGETKVRPAIQGRDGIASEYDGERDE